MCPNSSRMIVPLIKGVFATVAVVAVARQCRKPAWLPGRLILKGMTRGHRGMMTWGLSRIPIEKGFAILDVGCGAGQAIDALASCASAGTVHGIDYSAVSVAASRAANAAR